MRRHILLSTLAAGTMIAGVVQAQPAEVTVTLSPEMIEEAENLGQRDVHAQASELVEAVSETLTRQGALAGATIRLVLTDLKPNRPTMQQAIDRPGLSIIDSVSIGGATIEGEVTTADGRTFPVEFDYYSPSIRDVYGYATWHDADRAFDRFARRLADGRYGA